MWRRIGALLCITCQYQCAGSQRDADWRSVKFHGKNAEELLSEFSDRVGICEPVTAADGHTYERVAIEEWLATGSRTSPTTNEPLQSTALIPQHTVKKLVCAFMDTRRRSSVDGGVESRMCVVTRRRQPNHWLPHSGRPRALLRTQ